MIPNMSKVPERIRAAMVVWQGGPLTPRMVGELIGLPVEMHGKNIYQALRRMVLAGEATHPAHGQYLPVKDAIIGRAPPWNRMGRPKPTGPDVVEKVARAVGDAIALSEDCDVPTWYWTANYDAIETAGSATHRRDRDRAIARAAIEAYKAALR